MKAPDVRTLEVMARGFAHRLRKAFPGASVLVSVERTSGTDGHFFATVEAPDGRVAGLGFRWGLGDEPDIEAVRHYLEADGVPLAAE